MRKLTDLADCGQLNNGATKASEDGILTPVQLPYIDTLQLWLH